MIVATTQLQPTPVSNIQYISSGLTITGPTHYQMYSMILKNIKEKIVVREMFINGTENECSGYFRLKSGVCVGFSNSTPTNTQSKRIYPPTLYFGYFDMENKIGLVKHEVVLEDYQHLKSLEFEIRKVMFEPMRKMEIFVKNLKTAFRQSITIEQKDCIMMELGRLNFRSSSPLSRFMPWQRIGEVERQLYGKGKLTLLDLYSAFTNIVQKDPPLRQLRELSEFNRTVNKFIKN